MTFFLDRLATLIRPPSDLASKFDWIAIENQLGHKLPWDYKQIVEMYGPGVFDDFLWILQPSNVNPNIDLCRQSSEQLNALRTLREGGEEVPFELNIGDEQLAPWAVTDNGDICYWVRSSSHDPDQWIVTVNDSREPLWMTLPFTTAEFLYKILSRNLRLDIFPEDFPSHSPRFTEN
ncbi:hypothetical protein KEM60_03342 [Austwickia sp. TVS 96-490-7B]|uniref:SMI1/KNR4 family protein n=1 Tax=Austwickia sp. TVS 96-490-7B TaxID=2830843 RepID=UPI001C570AB4|nr:SMI1/KNR4 family protein [Austwickia sp. TVS 96-490-7B]MBW3087112.1 hypothetical protein [Austwickia sp. TVS 96-490-7B]